MTIADYIGWAMTRWRLRHGNRVGNNGRYLAPFATGIRRFVRSAKRMRVAGMTQMEHVTRPNTIARIELDTRADTSCAGTSFHLEELTGQVCNVQPFSDAYAPMTDISVATCFTAYDDPDTGKTHILVFNETLWFGSSMDHSLMNPNQVRANGFVVSDDPFDSTRPFGIQTPNLFIPFQTEGTTVFFNSRVPSDEEIRQCRPHINLTSDQEWAPSSVCLQSVRTNEETSYHRIEEIATGTKVPVRVTETDCVLESVSPVYCQQAFTERLVSAVRIRELPRRVEHVQTTTEQQHVLDLEYFQQRWAAEVVSNERHTTVSSENLARKWGIGLQTAQQTLRVTTQRGIRTAIHPLHRRYRVDHMNLHRKRLNSHFYVDHLSAKVKSLDGNSGAYLYTNGKFTSVIPCSSRTEAGDTLRRFTEDVGIPNKLTADLASEMSGKHTEFVKRAKDMHIEMSYAEKGRSNQNYAAEMEIGKVKERWKQTMVRKNVPTRLWDRALVYHGEILSRMARGRFGRTGIEELTGETPDISDWLDFDFYDLVWWLEDKKAGTVQEQIRLGRWLGIAHNVGSALCYWILTEAGHIVARTSVQHVTRDERLEPTLMAKITTFDETVKTRLDDANFVNPEVPGVQFIDAEPLMGDGVAYGDGTKTPSNEEYGETQQELSERDDIEDSAYDKYIGAEVVLDTHDGKRRAVVKRRVTDEVTGVGVGSSHRNPLFDTREYELQFDDGTTDVYFANAIAENIYSQVDTEGNQHLVIDEIDGHRVDGTELKMSDGYVTSKNGTRVPKKTTRGWSFHCTVKEGFDVWVRLKDLKDSDPVQLAEYAVANNIDREPAFIWWVPYTLKKRNRIIAKMSRKYWRTETKYGLEIPKTLKRALEIDQETGTDFWAKAIAKEMSRVKIAYEPKPDASPNDIRSGADKTFIGYQEISCHLVWDIKMDFTRKARWCANGATTVSPPSLTYSSVVSRDSVRLAFLAAELNNLDILAADVSNAYLNAPCREKIWFVAGPELNDLRGTVCVITRALYGLKSSGAAWRSMLMETITGPGLQFEPTIADPDVYRRRAIRTDGVEYWELLCVYVDDILCVSHNPQAIMDVLAMSYDLKEDSMGPPSIYLGAGVEKYQLDDGTMAWSVTSQQYVENALLTVDSLLKQEGLELKAMKKSGNTPLPHGYRPELEASAELGDNKASRYLQLIGILRWAVELGRIDIHLEVALMSQYNASPRVGHLEAVYHIFAYLSKHKKLRMVFDARRVAIDETAFAHTAVPSDWHDFYGELEEELPPKMPPSLGQSVRISCFVDANHAGNAVTRRSHTGILIFVQNTPIIWFSKKQNTVESSTFGSEFVALRVARDLIVALRYKLRMFGIPIDGPADVFCDNQGVVNNTTMPQSTLSKKHNAVNYHACREAACAGIWRIAKEDTETNLADLLTKTLSHNRRWTLLGGIAYAD